MNIVKMVSRYSPTSENNKFYNLYNNDVLYKTIHNFSNYYDLVNLKNTDKSLKESVLLEEPHLTKIAEIITKKSRDVLLSMNVSYIEYSQPSRSKKSNTVPQIFKEVDTFTDTVCFTFCSPDIHDNRIIIKTEICFDIFFNEINISIKKSNSKIYNTTLHTLTKTRIINNINKLLEIYHRHGKSDTNTFIVIKKTPSIEIISTGKELKKEKVFYLNDYFSKRT